MVQINLTIYVFVQILILSVQNTKKLQFLFAMEKYTIFLENRVF